MDKLYFLKYVSENNLYKNNFKNITSYNYYNLMFILEKNYIFFDKNHILI